jgi:hypothetical protein
MAHCDLIVDWFTREYERIVGGIEDTRRNNAIDVRLISPPEEDHRPAVIDGRDVMAHDGAVFKMLKGTAISSSLTSATDRRSFCFI